MGGEAALPLNYFRLLSRRNVAVYLLVHSRVKNELAAVCPEEYDRITFIEDSWIHRLLWRVGTLMPRQIAEVTVYTALQVLTSFQQRRVARTLVNTFGIDVVHQPTPVSAISPSFMYSLGVPVVIGPMNGGMDYPPTFKHMNSRSERLALFTARFLASVCNRIIPGKRRAKILLVANQRTKAALPRSATSNVQMLTENGVDLTKWSENVDSGQGDRDVAKFVFVGALQKLKGVDMLIEAFGAVRREVDARLIIIGHGPERTDLEQLSAESKVSSDVTFAGFCVQSVVRSELIGATAMIFPSLHDCGGAVVLEAMACSIPVVALRWGGPVDYLDDSCGILIAPTSRTQIINELEIAMTRLAHDRHTALEMGRAGRRRVETCYSWDQKINQILQIYTNVIECA